MLKVSSSGSFDFIENFLKRLQNGSNYKVYRKYGELGVKALAQATPLESGETARSWRYEITGGRNKVTITWLNDHVEEGVNIAVILQYGHATGTGGWVEGKDYITPALRPVFEDMITEIWAEVIQNA